MVATPSRSAVSGKKGGGGGSRSHDSPDRSAPGTSHSGSSMKLQLQKKMIRPKLLRNEDVERENARIEMEEKDYEQLVINRNETAHLIQTIQKQDFESALTCIKNCFGYKSIQQLQSVSNLKCVQVTEPVVYSREKEDREFRDEAMAQFFLDAALEGVRMAFVPLQLANWLSILKKTHEDVLSRFQLQEQATSKTCASIFQENLFTRFTASTKNGKICRIFWVEDARRMIDYFSETYIQHFKLVTWMLTKSQKVEMIRVTKVVESGFSYVPLNQMIPAEKWEDYLAGEADKVRKQIEAEKEAIEEAKRQEQEKARKEQEAIELAEAALLKKLRMTINIPPIAPFPEPFPIEISPETVIPVNMIAPLKAAPQVPQPVDGTPVEGQPAAGAGEQVPTETVVAGTASPEQPSTVIQGTKKTEPEESSVLPPLTEITLTPLEISTILTETANQTYNTVQGYIEKRIDYNLKELMDRFELLATERVAVRKREKEIEMEAAPKVAALTAASRVTSNVMLKKEGKGK
ncbi:hypothetical protein HDU76_010918 [Blyttiomyces sp. JEL0837]|nr:hypothetical protein HDU76_010918 [Blyttiomyces sp. JEL0837]